MQSSSCQGLGSGEKREKLVKAYKLSAIRWIKSEDLMYNMMTVVDNIVLYDWSTEDVLIPLVPKKKRGERYVKWCLG